MPLGRVRVLSDLRWRQRDNGEEVRTAGCSDGLTEKVCGDPCPGEVKGFGPRSGDDGLKIIGARLLLEDLGLVDGDARQGSREACVENMGL